MADSLALENDLAVVEIAEEAEEDGELIDIKEAALIRLRNKIKGLKVQARDLGDFEELKKACESVRHPGESNGSFSAEGS